MTIAVRLAAEPGWRCVRFDVGVPDESGNAKVSWRVVEVAAWGLEAHGMLIGPCAGLSFATMFGGGGQSVMIPIGANEARLDGKGFGGLVPPDTTDEAAIEEFRDGLTKHGTLLPFG
jgi:hypothetical protein